MSLIQLLLVGRSVERERSAPGRYRMVDKSYLPNFGPPSSVREKLERSAKVVGKGFEVGPKPVTSTSKPLGESMALKLRFLEKERRVEIEAQGTITRPTDPAGPSLEEVQVLRNDLVETDLDVVVGSGSELRHAQVQSGSSKSARVRLLASLWGQQRSGRFLNAARSTILFFSGTHAR
jgi:hypothetical protein